MMELAVALMLIVWGLLSIANQSSVPWLRRAKFHDACAVIPSWSFFAPNPGRTDHLLLYCDHRPDGSRSMWRYVDLAMTRSFLSVIWNPGKRKNKALTDLTSELTYLASLYSHKSIMLTTPYLMLLNLVLSQSHDAAAVRTEFVVVESFGNYSRRAPAILFESGVHDLGTVGDGS
jgi:hypothetical protein